MAFKATAAWNGADITNTKNVDIFGNNGNGESQPAVTSASVQQPASNVQQSVAAPQPAVNSTSVGQQQVVTRPNVAPLQVQPRISIVPNNLNVNVDNNTAQG